MSRLVILTSPKPESRILNVIFVVETFYPPSLSMSTRALIWGKLIAPHSGDVARLVSIPIMARDSATEEYAANLLTVRLPNGCLHALSCETHPPQRHLFISVTRWGQGTINA